MRCPRCTSWLRIIEPGAIFLRHLICDDCWSAWRIEVIRYIASDEENPRIRYKKTETVLIFGRHTREERLAAA